MTTENLTLYEIRTIGLDALIRELGAAGAIRFIQQYQSGLGRPTPIQAEITRATARNLSVRNEVTVPILVSCFRAL